MTFIILPSHRILQFIRSQNVLRVLNIHAQAYAVSQDNGKTALATIYNKTFTLNQGNHFQTPILERTFPKHLNCLVHSTHKEQSCFIASDKFGDIHQIDLKDKIKLNSSLLNSNLGIPSFIHCFEDLLLVGDQLNKIKIYNLKNMHEIRSIWYVPFWQPMSIVQIGEKEQAKFVILGRLRNKQQLEEAEEVYLINYPKDLICEDFPGKKIFEGKNNSYAKEPQIRDSTIISGNKNTVFYLTLEKNQITIQRFNFEKQQSDQIITKILQIQQIESDYLYGVYDVKTNCLFISYGKQTDSEEEISLKQIKLGEQKQEFITLNKYERIIKLTLQ